MSRGSAAVLLALLPATGCGDDPAPAGPGTPVSSLAVVSGDDQLVWTGRRSEEPFTVHAYGPGATIPEGEVVTFSLSPEADAGLSQPRALVDEEGFASTWVLDPHGEGDAVLTARAGGAEARFRLRVRRAPDSIAFDEPSGATGLPGTPHPDSLIRVTVYDTEGEPLPGTEVWFSAPGELSRFADTTDARGRAGTVLRRTRLSAGSGAVFAFVLGFPDAQALAHRPTEAVARRAVVVVVDGLRGDAIDRHRPPVLSRLAREGAWTDRARTVVPSITVPAHLSLLAGVGPEVHGVFSDRIRLTPEMADLEPLFLHAGDRGRRSAAFLTEVPPLADFREALACRAAFGIDSLTLTGESGLASAETAAGALGAPGLDLAFVHVPDPEVAGHAHGWSSPEYGEAVLRADSAVARVAASIDPDSVLLIVTADHGGGGAFGDHLSGSSSPEDVEIPLILWGSRVAETVPDDATILDVAPTALWAVGIAPPAQYEGEVLLGSFR